MSCFLRLLFASQSAFALHVFRGPRLLFATTRIIKYPTTIATAWSCCPKRHRGNRVLFQSSRESLESGPRYGDEDTASQYQEQLDELRAKLRALQQQRQEQQVNTLSTAEKSSKRIDQNYSVHNNNNNNAVMMIDNETAESITQQQLQALRSKLQFLQSQLQQQQQQASPDAPWTSSDSMWSTAMGQVVNTNQIIQANVVDKDDGLDQPESLGLQKEKLLFRQAAAFTTPGPPLSTTTSTPLPSNPPSTPASSLSLPPLSTDDIKAALGSLSSSPMDSSASLEDINNPSLPTRVEELQRIILAYDRFLSDFLQTSEQQTQKAVRRAEERLKQKYLPMIAELEKENAELKSSLNKRKGLPFW